MKVAYVKEIGTGVREMDGIPGTGRAANEYAIIDFEDGERRFKLRLDATTDHDEFGFEYRYLTEEERALTLLKQVTFSRAPKKSFVTGKAVEILHENYYYCPNHEIWALCPAYPEGYGAPVGRSYGHKVEIWGHGTFEPVDLRKKEVV